MIYAAEFLPRLIDATSRDANGIERQPLRRAVGNLQKFVLRLVFGAGAKFVPVWVSNQWAASHWAASNAHVGLWVSAAVTVAALGGFASLRFGRLRTRARQRRLRRPRRYSRAVAGAARTAPPMRGTQRLVTLPVSVSLQSAPTSGRAMKFQFPKQTI